MDPKQKQAGNDAFQQLLAALKTENASSETMIKSLTPAAPGTPAPGEENNEETNEEGKPGAKAPAAAAPGAQAPGAADPENKPGEEPLTKSFVFVDENGKEQTAIDVTEFMTKGLPALLARIDGVEENLLTLAEGSVTSLAHHGQMIKSMMASVQGLGNRPAGRKSVLSVHEKTTDLLKSLPGQQPEEKKAGLSGEQILVKSLNALQSGKISGLDAATIEGLVNVGKPVPADLMARINEESK